MANPPPTVPAPSGSSSYVGNRDAASSSTPWNTQQFLIDEEKNQMRTATLGKIVTAPYSVSSDGTKTPIEPGSPVAIGYVDVQPLVNQQDGDGNATQHKTVYRLSYMRYQGGNGAFISDPVIGDVGKVVVADRDTSSVRATGGQISNPGSRRKYDLADGSFFGCTIAGAPGQYFSWTATGFVVHDRNGNTYTGSPTGFVLADAAGNSIASAAAGITINGWLFPRGKTDNINLHTHNGVTVGGGVTGPVT